MTRLDPNTAKERFYTKKMTKGCAIVAFYNHRNNFTKEEIDLMIKTATNIYSNLRWQTLTVQGDKEPTLFSLFVWVDIIEDKLWIGSAFAGDGISIGYIEWNQAHKYDGSAQFICSCLGIYAKDYWEEGLGGFDKITKGEDR